MVHQWHSDVSADVGSGFLQVRGASTEWGSQSRLEFRAVVFCAERDTRFETELGWPMNPEPNSTLKARHGLL